MSRREALAAKWAIVPDPSEKFRRLLDRRSRARFDQAQS